MHLLTTYLQLHYIWHIFSAVLLNYHIGEYLIQTRSIALSENLLALWHLYTHRIHIKICVCYHMTDHDKSPTVSTYNMTLYIVCYDPQLHNQFNSNIHDVISLHDWGIRIHYAKLRARVAFYSLCSCVYKLLRWMVSNRPLYSVISKDEHCYI